MKAYNKKKKPRHEVKVKIDNCTGVTLLGKKVFSYNEYFYRNSKSLFKYGKKFEKYKSRLFVL